MLWTRMSKHVMAKSYAQGLERLQFAFPGRILMDVPLARYTSARLGGPAEALIVVRSKDELIHVADYAWMYDIPFVLLGGGSNVLISDQGVHGLVILNRAQKMQFQEQADAPSVWAESGASLGVVSRRAAQKGLSGLEWAAGIPGTVGGAVVGNAGAHGQDIASCLLVAEILQPAPADQRVAPTPQLWGVEQCGFGYRRSAFKGTSMKAVVLSASFRLAWSTRPAVEAKMKEYQAYRQKTQPPGASMGSMFKNPPGDYAGRLIEAAGLKGVSIGDAQISPLHANFFINRGHATSMEVYRLIELAREKVHEKFGIWLELEIELLGDW